MNVKPEMIFSTPRFDVLKETEGGKDFYYVAKPDSAIAVVSDCNGRIAMMRTTRINVEGPSWELPGGRVEEGELPAKTVIREVVEELGVEGSELQAHEIDITLPLPSVTTERAHIFRVELTSDLEAISGERDGSHEGIREVRAMRKSSVIKMIREGKVACAVDAYALLLAFELDGADCND